MAKLGNRNIPNSSENAIAGGAMREAFTMPFMIS